MTQIESASIERRLRSYLKAREANGQLRSLKVYEGIDFCSNDYLGLARLPLDHNISTPSKESGSSGSRLISGNSDLTEQFEAEIAEFHGFENSLLFSSGYAANTGLLACVGQRGDQFFLDELIHASLIDGARLSYAKRHRFKHNDVDDLERRLQHFTQNRSSDTQSAFVIVESLYSMDGDTAPLEGLVEVCKQYDAALIVDEAHAIGVYGDKGAGLISQLGLQSDVFAAVYTFGKAVGYHGATIAGSHILRDYLINFCRPFIYTTAQPPHTIASLKSAYLRFGTAETERSTLRHNISYFTKTLKLLNFENANWFDSDGPIQGLVINGTNNIKLLEKQLADDGFAIKAIVSPSVKEGSERIRICLHSSNTFDEIDYLAECLSRHLGAVK